MMSDRPYRKALDLHDAVREIEDNSGTQFDPAVVRVFVEAILEGESSAGHEPERARDESHAELA
jgi:HD-GYP domain-containing protein (c-di-GMP phosphodiesterase class II)